MPNHTHTHTHIYICIFFFHHTTCESMCDTLASSAANQGDNTVSVAQGGTATPGATEQLLPPDRVFKEIYIYVYTRSTKSGHYIGRSFIFILVQFVILKCVYLQPLDVIATVSWFCVITWERWFRVYNIRVEILSISVIYSVSFLLFMRYCPKALETNVIYISAKRFYLLINWPSRWVVSKKKGPGLSLSR